jgi:type IV pilus assembly protein PilB
VRKKIGECLVQAGLITEADLQTALAEHKRSGERLGAVLVRMNLATERQIAKALAYQLGFSYINLAENPPDPIAVILIPKDVALKRTCIAISVEKNLLTVSMSDPLLFTLVQDLEFQTGYRIKQVVSTKQEIVDAIHSSYPDKALARVNQAGAGIAVQAPVRGAANPGEATPHGGMLAPLAEQSGLAPRRIEDDVFEQSDALKGATPETAPIIDLVDLVIKSALKSRASDIHIEPTETNLIVRHRLDGLLKEVMDLPKWVHEGLASLA